MKASKPRYDLPHRSNIVFRDESERRRVEQVARTSGTDIRILIGQKFNVITKDEGSALSDVLLGILLTEVVVGVRTGKSPKAIKAGWRKALANHQTGDRLRGGIQSADTSEDLYENARRQPGHFQANC